MKKIKKILAFIIILAVFISMTAFTVAQAVEDTTAPTEAVVTPLDEPAPADAETNYVALIIVVVVVFGLTIAAFFIAKKGGTQIVDVAKAIVTAVSNALADSNISVTVHTALNLIIESLAYVQSLYSNEYTIQQRTGLALDQIRIVAGEMKIKLNESDYIVISSVLLIGFSIMDGLGVSPNVNTEKFYSAMADTACVETATKKVVSSRLQTGARR